MKTIFFGTPEAAVPFLQFLAKQSEVIAVVTRPDKPAERGQHLHQSPVKIFAEEKKIPILQPTALKDPNFLAQISNLKAEAGIVVAYGRILPPEVIRLFPSGIYNIHFSLLPHLRGAAPIQWSILRGDSKTGVTAFRISESLDTGNILVQKSLEISPNDNAVTLEDNLVALGLTVLDETLRLIKKGEITGQPQTGEPTNAPLLKKEQAKIDWNKPTEEIAMQVRALIRLGAFTHLPNGKILKILRAEPAQDSTTTPDSPSENVPGALCGIEKGRGFLIQCQIGKLLVIKVCPEGKKEMDAWAFLQGARLKIGDQFF